MNQNMTKQHCVVLADVVDSRKIDDRDSFKKEAGAAISEVNQRHQHWIQAEFSVIKGLMNLVVSSVQSSQLWIFRRPFPEFFIQNNIEWPQLLI